MSKVRIPASGKEKHAAAVATLEQAGATDIRTARNGRNHIVVAFEISGRPGSLLLAGTPGDRHRQLAQARSTARTAIRRAVGGQDAKPLHLFTSICDNDAALATFPNVATLEREEAVLTSADGANVTSTVLVGKPAKRPKA